MGAIGPQLSLNIDLGICKKRSRSPMHVHGGRLVRATVFAMLRIELNNAFAVCLAGTADGRGQSPLQLLLYLAGFVMKKHAYKMIHGSFIV